LEAKEKDEAAWQAAVKKNTREGYVSYINAGHKLYKTEAEKRMAGHSAGSGKTEDRAGGGTDQGNHSSGGGKELKQLGIAAASILLVIAMIWRPWEEGGKDIPPQVEDGEVSERVVPMESQAELLKKLDGNMVFVPGGTFTMGCTKEQGGDCFEWEKPLHQVTVSDYYIGKYEVTQKEWREVMGSDPPELYFKGCDNCPVDRVSWADIQEFLTKLNAKTGKVYRLPTEAEWDYAARGGSSSLGYKYSGSSSLSEVAWYDGNSGSKTHPVGQKKANELGLYDMSGNVWEWCADDWHDNYRGAPTNGRAWIDSPRASYRVYRGGDWGNVARLCRVSNRGNDTPSSRYPSLGFRLAL
jgi:formylglycine-generating enzyme required for sulfatase activity